MRNTLIGLDILFIRADGTIESIFLGAKAGEETPMPSKDTCAPCSSSMPGSRAWSEFSRADRVEPGFYLEVVIIY